MYTYVGTYVKTSSCGRTNGIYIHIICTSNGIRFTRLIWHFFPEPTWLRVTTLPTMSGPVTGKLPLTNVHRRLLPQKKSIDCTLTMGEDTETDLLVLVDHEQAEREEDMSQLSLGEHSYILDLANQKHFRKARRQEEALEEAMDLYNAAVEEGAPKTKELFKLLITKVFDELQEENREKDRLQDAWLEAALQEELERRENPKQSDLNTSLHTVESLGASLHQPPSIYNGARNTVLLRSQSSKRMIELDQQIHEEEIKILKKKLKKAEKMMKEIVDEKGQERAQQSRKYNMLKKKIKEYRATLKKAEQDELKVSRHSGGVMYDWHIADENSDNTEESSTSSNKSNGPDEGSTVKEDLDWAKEVVSKLTLTDQANGNDAVQTIREKYHETPEKTRAPHKALSFDTVMATTCQMSGHEIKSKVHTGARKTQVPPRHLPTTTEENETEDAANPPPRSTYSKLFPRNQMYSPQQSIHSPGKRKSPSWKNVGTDPVADVPKSAAPHSKTPIAGPPLFAIQDSQAAESSNEPLDKESKSPGSTWYTLADFVEGRVPDGIDTSAWEEYLSTDEFEKSFGMTKQAFEKLPKWKRVKARRQLRTW